MAQFKNVRNIASSCSIREFFNNLIVSIDVLEIESQNTLTSLLD